MQKRKTYRRVTALLAALVIIAVCISIDINSYVLAFSSKYTLSTTEASELSDVDCILVLGCGVWGDSPSPLLEDRLIRGVELYNNGVSEKILMSGDHGTKDYDEVNVMRTYAEDNGIAAEDIFMDHAGFSTYESMYRARDIFCADKVVIVTQGYHLSRSIFIARALGLDAYGVASDYHVYAGQEARDFREVLAREKDFLYAVFKPEPTYLGEQIPISGNGTATAG